MTCRTPLPPLLLLQMGPKAEGGVVDEELRVHGIAGLRVVDSSVLPLLPGELSTLCMLLGMLCAC